MRPVNLIPSDERRGESAPARAGAASYIVVAVLIAILFAVTGVVLTNNSVKDKQSQLAAAETKRTEVEARAAALANFADFQEMKDARVQTVSQLAQSRFDWQRVMNELSRVIPETVWLTNVTGSVAPAVQVPEAAEVPLRMTVPGPALALEGCARSQQDVAAMISAMGDIDGVSRVLVEKSEKPGNDVGSTGGGAGLSDDCRTRNYIAQFKLVAAFDAVVAGQSAPEAAATPPATAAPEPTPAAAPTEPDAAGQAEQASAPEEAQAQSNVAKGTARAKKAAGLIGAGGG